MIARSPVLRAFATVLLTTLAVMPLGAAAQSDVVAQAATPAPAPSTGLFGDFGGGRSALAARGVSFRGHIVSESAGNPIGGFQQGTALASEVMLGSDVDFGKREKNGLGILHLTLTVRAGSSLSANAIGNVFTVQEIFGSGLTPRLTEASYEQPFAHEKIDLALGRIITENDFGASPTYWGGNLYCSYQSNAVCGTPIAVPINSGYDAYPQSVWGARIKVSPTPKYYVETGAYQVDPKYGNRGNGFDLGFAGTIGTYLPVEIGIMSLGPDLVPTGSLRIGGYFDTSRALQVDALLTRFDGRSTIVPAALPSTVVRGRYGYWAQADHLIAGAAGPGKRGTALFATYTSGDPQTALITTFLNAGVVQHGTFAGRTNDTVSVGYAYGNINPNLRAFETALDAAGYNVPVNGQEQIGEVNYGVQVRPWLSLRPGVQYVRRPAGDAAIKNALVLDLSTALTF
jgi:porin